MWHDYFSVTIVEEALQILAERGPRARIVAGATDLILELERGVRKGIDTLIDITRVRGLEQITLEENCCLHLGAMVTHNHCADSKLVREYAFPLAQAAWEVGAPQIRNRGTVAGNLITASPANDTITPLMALGASVTLRSLRAERIVPLDEFYTGVRKTVMQPDEILVDISFPGMKENQRGMFIKLGLRRAQAISVINVAAVLTFSEAVKNGQPAGHVEGAAITLGSVAPVIVHAQDAEASLLGRELDEDTILRAGDLARQAARPIDDVRGSADYRADMVQVCTGRALRAIAAGKERLGYPVHPVLLASPPANGDGKETRGGESRGTWQGWNGTEHRCAPPGTPIVCRINGKETIFTSGQDKTLLRLLREDAGLIGTKEGCAEGECGACTVFLDGMAVMSCLVPAVRAHGAEIVTIEGIARDGRLHPVQQAFVEDGAVQCGYCTPGFIMSAVKLLEERPHPTHDEVHQAITGNLCRCTGYYKIVKAIERAVEN